MTEPRLSLHQPGTTFGEREASENWLPRRVLVLASGTFLLLLVAAFVGIGYGAWTVYMAPKPAVPVLAPTVDGVGCSAREAIAYHIHVHLALYDRGNPVPLPSSIGVVGGEVNPRCFYWIHVHAATPNIVHIESPTPRIYTLGQFLDIWSATKIYADPSGDAYVVKLDRAAAAGDLSVYLDAKPWNGLVRSVPLTRHESITLEIGHPIVPPSVFRNWGAL